MKRFTAVVFAGLLAASLPLAAQTPPFAGPDFQVNVVTQGSQDNPDVARDAAGDFVVVWSDAAQSGQPLVKARLYCGSGTPKSGEILVWPVAGSFTVPRVAVTPQGAFVVVWSDGVDVYMRRFDRFGQARGPAFVVYTQTTFPKHSPDVDVDAAGNATVVWVLEGATAQLNHVYLQRFDTVDRPLGIAEQVDQGPAARRSTPRVDVNATGSALVSWTDEILFQSNVYARRFDGPSGSWAPETRVNSGVSSFQEGSAPVLHPEGDGLVLFHSGSLGKLLAQRLDAAGARLGGPIEIGPSFAGDPPSAAADDDGNVLAAWVHGPDADGVFARLLNREGTPVADAFRVSPEVVEEDWRPSVAGGAAEGFVVVWSNGDGIHPTLPAIPFPPQDGRDGSLFGVFAQRFGTDDCLGGGEVLCLHGGRFEARVTLKNPLTGQPGAGAARPLTTDTGAFWFFGEDNLELILKVLDGRGVNGHFWVYIGALSDVEYTVEIVDTATLRTKTYRNRAGRLASQADAMAFPDVGQELPVVTPTPKVAAARAKAAGSCVPSPEILCLGDGRFQVEVRFTDPRLGSPLDSRAQAIPLTGDTGAFWFFDARNVELMIKILDGRPHNGHFWIYYGALSDVRYTITVTDTVTQEVKAYENAPGRLVSRADVEALPLP
jgi:hypothetical protein